MTDRELLEPRLCAFVRDDGLFNVWRYDTPTTVCVLWGVVADDMKHAIVLAAAEIGREK